ncbi:MAG: glycosyltransferase, partial [Anaerolineales bacterium]|nr:glycosyltransferase [Anaerolineales bacterium]
QRLIGKTIIPLPLLFLEGLGNLLGPVAYWQARRQAARLDASDKLALASTSFLEDDLEDVHLVPPTVAVIICTRQRPDALRRCLQSLAPVRGQMDQLIVVENSEEAGETAVIAEQFGAQFELEPEPGLCRARNRGLAAAHTDVVAYLDDDVVVEENWLVRLTAVYTQNPHIAGVTGLVLPQQLETDDQNLFEQALGGLNRGLTPRSFNGKAARTAAPQVGVGANMSFRRQQLAEIGGFDVALDPGTLALAGGDIDIFYQLLKAGCTLLYDPQLLVWHAHRREAGAARQMSAAYGRGTAAAYAKWAVQGDVKAARMLLGYWLRYHPARLRHSFARNGLLSPDVAWAGWLASWVGPWAYFRERRLNRTKSFNGVFWRLTAVAITFFTVGNSYGC